MKQLSKIWIRVLVSFFGGGIANEIFFLSTGDATRSREHEGTGITLMAALLIFALLTLLVNIMPQEKSKR